MDTQKIAIWITRPLILSKKSVDSDMDVAISPKMMFMNIGKID